MDVRRRQHRVRRTAMTRRTFCDDDNDDEIVDEMRRTETNLKAREQTAQT